MKPITTLWVLGFVAWLLQLEVWVCGLRFEIIGAVVGIIVTYIWIEKEKPGWLTDQCKNHVNHGRSEA